MGLYKTLVKYVNRNTFLSNALLLPALYCAITGIINIYNWNLEPSRSLTIYLSLWYIIAILIFFVIFFSVLYHSTMYDMGFPILRKIAKLDYILTAPLFAAVMVFLFFVYIKFLSIRSNIQCDMSNLNVEIFGVASVYLIFGFFFYIFKKFYQKGWKRGNIEKKIVYLMTHTFFHYIGYTGITLLLMVYLLDNRNIYETFFLKKC